jgi:hypothetical protein
MRLLERRHDGDIRLTKPFLDHEIPPYAILSHTWGSESEEVVYEDMVDGSAPRKSGFRKIKFCAQQAFNDGLTHFWVDSCCIKKSSDAELSEAINSMFSWYRRAAKCFVYLSDVSTRATHIEQAPDLRKSRWFTRGWTLQELIAPRIVEFFSKEGNWLGDKLSLQHQITQVTGIPPTALSGSPLSTFSVAERMRWATGRNTTRKEDRAYCLLGIFEVFIPPIYGEGDHAFVRLREAIETMSQIGKRAPSLNSASHTYVPIIDNIHL